MSLNMYLKIPQIVGGSTDKGFEGSIDVLAFSWGASNPTTVGTTGGGLSAGKVSVSSFNVMKKTEGASAALFQACCQGTHFATAEVWLRKATGDAGEQQVFLKYKFSDVMVESVQWSGSSGGDDTPTESCSFAFAKVEIEYSKQDTVAGGMTVAGQAAWDLTKASAK